MGNFEKLVVLTVLFLSAIVLAISLNDGKKKGEAGKSPLSSARAQLAGEGARTGTAPAPGTEERKAELLLSTEVRPESSTPRRQEPAAAASGADGLPGLLRSTDGLRAAGIDDYMVYTARDGDTWAGLSERFYGTGRHVSLLRHANEDMLRPREDETILVPVYDFAEEAGRRAPLTPEVRLSVAASNAGAEADEPTGAERAAPVAAEAAPSIDFRAVDRYQVRAGDSLSSIAQRVYGAGSRWNVIYEANRKLLQSPDWLQVGMDLTIPRGAAFDALAASVASASDETKPGAKSGRVR